MSLTVNSRPATWAGTSGPIIYKMTTTDHANAGYYLLVEIWNSTTGLKIGTQKCYPNSAGLLSVRVEAILKSNMSLDNNSDLTSGDTVYLDGNWIKYYIKYNQYWSGSSPALIDDVANLRYAICGGLQIGVINDFASYINAKFLNIEGEAIVNYPFTIEAILDSTANKLLVHRFLNGSVLTGTDYNISSVGVNRFKLSEALTADLLTLRMVNYTWTIRTSAADNDWVDVAYGNGIFVAVAGTGIGQRVMTSTNGVTWDIRSSAADNQWWSVVYGNGLFVAVAATGVGNRVMTSPDGITWTIRTSAADNEWYAVTYGNGLFVAVAGTGTGNRVMTSPDGIVWTIRSSAADNQWWGVAYGNGLFVAVGITGTGNRVMTSPDGVVWTSRSAVDNQWHSVTYGNGLFVAVSISGTGNRVMTSPDGVVWTIRSSAADNDWYAVTYGNGLFVATSSTGVGNRVMTSPDGITWTIRTSAADNGWYGVGYGNGIFIAVASTGFSNRVMSNSFLISETASIPVQPDCSNTVMLQWKNSLGGDECYPFTYNQEYTFDYGGGKKAKRLTLFAYGLSLSQWEAINGLNTLGEPYKTPITEMTTSLNRTMATIGQSVYILNSDGTKIGVTVVNVQNTTVTKKVQHEATVTIEYPEIFLQ